MFIEYIIIAFTALLIWILVDNYRPSKKLPPGPVRLPILGNALTFFQARGKAPFVLFRDVTKKYGPVAYLKMGSRPAIIVDDFDLSKQLLNSDVWISRPFDDLIGERSYGKPLGIIFVGGEGWREMRRFAMRTLRDFGYGKQTSMQLTIDEEVKQLLHYIDEVASKPEPILEMKHLFTMPVLNNLWSMVSNVRTPEDEAKLRKLIILVDNLAKATPMGGSILDLFPSLRHIAPGLTGASFVRQCIQALQEYFSEVLETRRKEGAYKEDNRDFIDMFIKEIDKHRNLGSNPNHYTDEQFITTITDLFEAGSETSSNTLEFAFFYMASNPRVQAQVQEEIDRVIGRNKCPTLADRPLMPYTEATLIEVQRMANVLPMTVRSPTESCTFAGYDIELDAMAIVNIYSIHMDESFWGDPRVFRPERYLDDNNQINSQKTTRVIPFGSGKRVCLGEQMAKSTMFTYFTSLLQSYTFEEVPRNDVSSNCAHQGKDYESVLFERDVHVGFTLSPSPFKTKLIRRQ